MKYLLVAAIIGLVILFGRFLIGRHELPEQSALIREKIKYVNEKFGYSIDLPTGFKVVDSVPELATIENRFTYLRVNAGCFDFGVENLKITTDLISIQGLPALKEDFYSDSKLVLRRITLNEAEKCFSIEITGATQEGWEQGNILARSFRLTR